MIPLAPTSFDAQAAEFDRRVGFAEGECRAIAAAVLRLAGAGPGDRVLEIGAGTGMIGRWFPAASHAGHASYIGLDVSLGMLAVFRGRSPGAPLVQADGAREWPLPHGCARVIFSSRAIHLLPLELVAREVPRVGAPGAVCVLGWVERRPDSIKKRMSREMQRRLRERGFPARSAGSRRVLQALRERGASELIPSPLSPALSPVPGEREFSKVVVASWPARHTPRQSLDDWRSKEGLGGIVLPPGVQDEVLRGLEEWAEETFGGLDAGLETEDAYVLEGVSL